MKGYPTFFNNLFVKMKPKSETKGKQPRRAPIFNDKLVEGRTPPI